MGDLVWTGCNFPNLVDCGDRPICGDCDEDCCQGDSCGGGGEPADCNNSGDDHVFDCSTKPLGWYADPFNCRKYYHCEQNYGTVKHHYLCELPGTVYNQLTVACDWTTGWTVGQGLFVMTVISTVIGILLSRYFSLKI